MSFLYIAIAVWAVAMLAWFMVSKYFKSNDLTRVKARLLGTTKAEKPKKGDAAHTGVLTQVTSKENNFAQVLVEKYQLGPKLGLFLEQAGVAWTPARFVHLTIVATGAGLIDHLAFFAGAGPRDRRCGTGTRLPSFSARMEEAEGAAAQVRGDFPGRARIRGPLDARRTRLLGVARND